jgi:hypothetical protein
MARRRLIAGPWGAGSTTDAAGTQLREYELHASGWVSVVVGLQSLISVYLIAFATWTYFRTPFELLT